MTGVVNAQGITPAQLGAVIAANPAAIAPIVAAVAANLGAVIPGGDGAGVSSIAGEAGALSAAQLKDLLDIQYSDVSGVVPTLDIPFGTAPGTVADGGAVSTLASQVTAFGPVVAAASSSASSANSAAQAAQLSIGTEATQRQQGDATNAFNITSLETSVSGSLSALSTGISAEKAARVAAFSSIQPTLTLAGTSLQPADLGVRAASLVGGTIPLGQLPASVVRGSGSANPNLGAWNASTNTPTLASGTAPAAANPTGDYYVVSVAGTTTLDGTSQWGVGDLVFWNTSAWVRIPASSVASVTSIGTLTGALTAAQVKGALAIGASDVAGLAAPATAQFGTVTGSVADGGVLAGLGATVAALPTTAFVNAQIAAAINSYVPLIDNATILSNGGTLSANVPLADGSTLINNGNVFSVAETQFTNVPQLPPLTTSSAALLEIPASSTGTIYGMTVAQLVSLVAQQMQPSFVITPIPAQPPNTAFTVTVTLNNYPQTPNCFYTDNGGALNSLGAAQSNTQLTFTHPGLPAGTQVISVLDANGVTATASVVVSAAVPTSATIVSAPTTVTHGNPFPVNLTVQPPGATAYVYLSIVGTGREGSVMPVTSDANGNASVSLTTQTAASYIIYVEPSASAGPATALAHTSLTSN